jgi:hypothetical protein
MLVPGFFIGVHHGIDGVAWAVTLISYLVLLPSLAIVGRHVGVSAGAQLANVAPVLVASTAMVAAITGVRKVLPGQSLSSVALLVVAAGFTYLAVLTMLQPRLPRQMVRDLLSR